MKEQVEFYILKKKEQVKNLLFDPAHKPQILPNFTLISNHDKQNINKFRLGLITLLLPFDFQQAKKDLEEIYSFLYPSDQEKLLDFHDSYTKDCSMPIFSVYTSLGYFYEILNKILKCSCNPLVNSWVRLLFRDMFSEIKKCYLEFPEQKEDLVFYRGGKMNDEELQTIRLNKNGFIEMQGFLSTTVDIQIATAERFNGGVLYEIQVPAHQRDPEYDFGFVYVSKFSAYPEKQCIFNALNVYKIVDIIPNFKTPKGNFVQYLVKLQYGCLAECMKKKKEGKFLTTEEKHLVDNFEHNYYRSSQINNQGDCLYEMGELEESENYFKAKLQKIQEGLQCGRKQKIKIFLKLCKIELDQQRENQAEQFLSNIDEWVKELPELSIQRLEYEVYDLKLSTRHLKANIKAKLLEKQPVVRKKLELIEDNIQVRELIKMLDYEMIYNYFCYLDEKEKAVSLFEKNKDLILFDKYKFGKTYFLLLKGRILMLVEGKKFDEAFTLCVELDEFLKIVLGENVNERMILKNCFGCIFVRTNKFQSALTVYREGELMADKIHGVNRTILYCIRLNIIHALLNLGKVDEAIQELQQKREWFENQENNGIDLESLSAYCSLVAWAFHEKGQKEISFQKMRKCDTILRNIIQNKNFCLSEIIKIKQRIGYEEFIVDVVDPTLFQ